jgi:hypothetical protein
VGCPDAASRKKPNETYVYVLRPPKAFQVRYLYQIDRYFFSLNDVRRSFKKNLAGVRAALFAA